MFTRYTWSNRDRDSPGLFPGIADGTQSSSQGKYHLTADLAVIGWTRPISASLVNELRIGYEHDNSFAQQEPFGQSGGNLVPGVPNNPAFAGGVTMITFANINTFIGSPNFLPKFQKTQQWQFGDTLSWTRGQHQFKFGTDVHAPQTDNFQDVPGLRGALNFDKIFSCERNASNQCVAGTGFSYADFLLGDPQTAMLSNQFEVNQKWYWFDFFAQDDFKVTPTPDLESRRSLRFLVAGLGRQQPLVEFRSGRQRVHHHRVQRIARIAHLGAAAEAGFFAAHRIRLRADSQNRAARRIRHVLRAVRSRGQRKSARAESAGIHQQQYFARLHRACSRCSRSIRDSQRRS